MAYRPDRNKRSVERQIRVMKEAWPSLEKVLDITRQAVRNSSNADKMYWRSVLRHFELLEEQCQKDTLQRIEGTA